MRLHVVTIQKSNYIFMILKEFHYLKLFFYMRAYYFLVYLKKLYCHAKITINRNSKYKIPNYYGTDVFGVEYQNGN